MMENKNLNLLPKPVLLRQATRNQYEGEGMEIATNTAWDDSTLQNIKVIISRNLNNRNVNDLSCTKVINSLDAADCIAKESGSDDDTVATCESDETDFQEEECLSIMPFRILGTPCSGDDSEKMANIIGECSCCYNDEHRQQQVLSPINMESLQSFFPFSKAEDNFWLRYSMVRDGGSIQTFLERAGRSKHSILAIETTDGEVFGAFTAEPWRKDWN